MYLYYIIFFIDQDISAIKQENDDFTKVSFFFIIYTILMKYCLILYYN